MVRDIDEVGTATGRHDHLGVDVVAHGAGATDQAIAGDGTLA